MDTSFPFVPPQVLAQAALCLSQSQTYFPRSSADTNARYSFLHRIISLQSGTGLQCGARGIPPSTLAGEVSWRNAALSGWAVSRLLNFFKLFINWEAAAKLPAGLRSMLTSDPWLGEGTWQGRSDVRDSLTN